MAEVAINVIGKDLLSAPFKLMQGSVSSLTSSLGSLGSMGANRSLDMLRSSVGSLTTEVQNLSSRAISPLTVAFGNLFSDVMRSGVDSILNLKRSVESFSFIRLNMDMEMTRSSFTTLTGSAEKANETLKILRQYANYTPFEFTQLTAATKKMLAFGFSVEEITKNYGTVGTGLLDVIGNAASALGAGQEGIERITRALGQMRGLARVSAEDMNQLTDVGIQGYQILAEQLGMSVKEVREAMKKGAIDADMGITALLKGMMKQYGGGMESFSKTAEGMSSTLNDYIADIKRSFGELAYKEYADLLREVTKLVGSPAFAKFAQMLGVQFGGVVAKLNNDILKPTVQRMYEFVNAIGASDAKMESLFSGMMARFRPVTETFRALMNILRTVSQVVIQFISAFVKLNDVKVIIKTVSTDFAYFLEGLFDLSARLNVSGSGIQRFAQAVMDFIRPVVDIIRNSIPVFKVMGDILIGFIKEIIRTGTLERVFNAVVNGLKWFGQALVDLVPRLIDIRDALPFLFDSFMRFAGTTIANIMSLGEALLNLGKMIFTFVNAVLRMKLTQDILKGILWLWEHLTPALQKIIPVIGDVTGKIPSMVQAVDNLYISIKTFISELISGGWDGAITRVSAFFGGLGETIMAQFGENGFLSASNLANLVSGGRDRIYTWILTTIRTGIDLATQNMPEIIAYLTTFLRVVAANFSGLLSTAWSWVSVDSTGIIASVTNLFRTMGDEVSKQLPAVGDWFSSLPQRISDAITANAPAVMTGIGTLWQFIKDEVGKIWTWVDTEGMIILDKALRGIGDTAVKAVNGIIGMFSSETFNNVFGELETSAIGAVESIGNTIGRMLVVFFRDYAPKISAAVWELLPQLLAVLTKLAIQVTDGIRNIIYGAVSGLLQGILNSLGFTEQAEQVKAFFDNMISMNRESVRQIATALDSFANFWRTIDILGTFNNFTRYVKDYVTNYLPTILQSLGAIPSLLVQMVSASLGDALNGLVNTIESTINGVMRSLNIAQGMQDWVGGVFKGVRGKIEDAFTSSGEAESAVRQWYDSMMGALTQNYDQVNGIVQFKNATDQSAQSTDKLANSVDAVTRSMSASNYNIYANGLNNVNNSTVALTNNASALTQMMADMGSQTTFALKSIGDTAATADYGKATDDILKKMSTMGQSAGATFVTSFATVMTGSGKNAMTNAMLTALDSVVTTLNSGTLYTRFYTVGQTIANGIMAGINANLTGILQTIYNRFDISGINNNISSLQSQVTTLQSQVAALQRPSSVGGGVPSLGFNSTVVNNKNVQLDVTINQTTPTDTVNNIRYAQALAASKIY